MNVDELFKCGVTPKKGSGIGKRFAVSAIRQDGIDVYIWGQPDSNLAFYRHGDYEIWRKPKTLFEDGSMLAAWGNLKRAVEEAGLGDDPALKSPPVSGLTTDARMPTPRSSRLTGKKLSIFISFSIW